MNRRNWLRAASGLFVAAPIAHSVFAPKFGAWFRQLFAPRYPTITREQAMLLLEPKLSEIWRSVYSRFPTEYLRFTPHRSPDFEPVRFEIKMTDFGSGYQLVR